MKTAVTNKGLKPTQRNASELLFEEYLNSQSLQFEHEQHSGRRQPDYRVTISDGDVICEVKELRARKPLPKGASGFDPYGGIRKEIHEVRKQFKEYKEFPCVLVLYNLDDWEFRDWPYVLFGAMGGDFAMQYSVAVEGGGVLPNSEGNIFTSRGKMADPKRRTPQNTTLSAIAVLSEFTILNPDFEKAFAIRSARLGEDIDPDQRIIKRLQIRSELHDQVPLTLGRCPRIVVFENPDARLPLPEKIFRGEFDERHRANRPLGRIERVYAGNRLLEAEHLESGDADIAKELQRFTQSIVERFDPEQIVLFGSHAHGTVKPGSDVDLLVVFPGDGDASSRSLEIRRRLNFAFPLDLIACSARETQRRLDIGDPFISEIIRNGVNLYQRANGA